MRIVENIPKLPITPDDHRWFIAQDAPLHLKTLKRLCYNTEFRYMYVTSECRYEVYYIRT